MGTVVADRVERPPSLFDLLDGPAAPAPAPAREAGLERRLLREREQEAADRDADRKAAADELDAGGVGHLHDRVGGESTLDDLLVGAWEGLAAQAAVSCPLCEGALKPLYADGGAGSPVVGGRCDSCETVLS
jgi:hypothetical protein